ncbi:MAG: DUF192 domain-containing protein [Minisyncoccia bacterium]
MVQTTLIGKILLWVLYATITVAVFATVIIVVSPKDTVSEVVIAGERLNVVVADTPALQEKGLSGRTSLKPNDGMLFIFPEPGFYGFWMKGMKIPIDIIWLNSERRIVDVWENATPDSYPRAYVSRAEAKYVLEVPSGFSSKYSLKEGDVLETESSSGYTR